MMTESRHQRDELRKTIEKLIRGFELKTDLTVERIVVLQHQERKTDAPFIEITAVLE